MTPGKRTLYNSLGFPALPLPSLPRWNDPLMLCMPGWLRGRFGTPVGRVVPLIRATLAVAAFLAATCPFGMAQLPSFDPLGAVNAALGSPISVAATVEPAAGGKPATLVVTATLEEGWHLYSLTQKPGGPKATRIGVDAASAWLPSAPFVPDSPPHVRTITDVPAWKGLQVEEHEGTVVWRAPLEPNAAGTGAQVSGSVSVQMCRETSCSPPASFPFTADAPALPTAPATVAPATIAAESGVLTACIFIWFMYSLVRLCFRKPLSVLHVAIGCAILSWQTAGLVEYNFGDSEVMLLVWLLLGSLLGDLRERAVR